MKRSAKSFKLYVWTVDSAGDMGAPPIAFPVDVRWPLLAPADNAADGVGTEKGVSFALLPLMKAKRLRGFSFARMEDRRLSRSFKA
jgi:hypothetical protein